MEIKVKHEELNDFQKKIDTGKEDLEDLIKQLKKNAEVLRTAWEGPDATAFCENFDYYLEKMDNLPIVLGNMSKFTKTFNTDMDQKDEAFKRELDKEANKYDDDKVGGGA